MSVSFWLADNSFQIVRHALAFNRG